MTKRVVVQTTVWQEDDNYRRELEWHVRRTYSSEELKLLRMPAATMVARDLEPDLATMLDKVLA